MSPPRTSQSPLPGPVLIPRPRSLRSSLKVKTMSFLDDAQTVPPLPVHVAAFNQLPPRSAILLSKMPANAMDPTKMRDTLKPRCTSRSPPCHASSAGGGAIIGDVRAPAGWSEVTIDIGGRRSPGRGRHIVALALSDSKVPLCRAGRRLRVRQWLQRGRRCGRPCPCDG